MGTNDQSEMVRLAEIGQISALLIGYMLHITTGDVSVMINSADRRKFAAEHMVDVTEVPDVGYVYTVRKK